MIQHKKKLVVVLAVLLALTGLGFYYYVFRSFKDPNLLRVSGNIEVTDVEMSFKIPGRVQRRFVDEGEKVTVGQNIALLDSSELIQEMAVRKAQMETAQGVLAELEAGSRPEEIRRAEAVVSRTKAELQRAEADRSRQKELYSQNAISTERYQQYETVYQVANARWQEAVEQLILLQKGPRQEKIEQARSQLQEAREQLKLAETRLGYASLASYISGVVLSKNVEVGEYVTAGTPLVTIGDLEHPWVRAYIDETDLGRVKVGLTARVTTDTYPSKMFEGRVTFIASEAEFTPKQVQTEKERVKLVFRVKITVSNPNMELKPGMPADAVILVQ